MDYEDDGGGVPPTRKLRILSLTNTEECREPSASHQARKPTPEKMQQSTENLPTNEDAPAVLTNTVCTLLAHHNLSSLDFFDNEFEADNSTSTDNNVFSQKSPITFSKNEDFQSRTLEESKSKLGTVNNIELQTIITNETSEMKNESGKTTSKIFMNIPERRNIKKNSVKYFLKRKRIKPRLSATIPENKLFPKKKRSKLRPRFKKVKQLLLINDNHDSGKTNRDTSNLEENPTSRYYRLGDKDSHDKKLVLKFKRLPITLQTKTELPLDNENLTSRPEEFNHGENVTTTGPLSINSLKTTVESAASKFEIPVIDLSKSSEMQFIDSLYEPILKDSIEKLRKRFESTFGTEMLEISEKKIIAEKNKNCETLLGSQIVEGVEGDMMSSTKIISYQGSSWSNHSSPIRDASWGEKSTAYLSQENPYDLLSEGFTNYYDSIFDNAMNAKCSEMGDLLDYIVNKEDLLYVKQQVNTKHTMIHGESTLNSLYNEIGLEKINQLNRHFLHIYTKICGVTDSGKQRKLLLIAWFVKIKNRISLISNRPWTLKETRLHLTSFLSQDNMQLPLVGEFFFRQEEPFLQDCMMVVDFILKNNNSDQDNGKGFQKNREGTDLPNLHHVFPDNKCNLLSYKSPQYSNAKQSINNCSNSLRDLKDNLPKKVAVHNNLANLEDSTNEEICYGEKQSCENELHLLKESPKYLEKEKYCCHLNIHNKGVNTEGQVKKVIPLVQELVEAYKKSPAEKIEKVVEQIRIGDIDLDYAKSHLLELLGETGSNSELYLIHKKIDDLIKRF